MSLREVIKVQEKQKRRFTWNNIEIFIKDPILNPEVQLDTVLNKISQRIPAHLFQNVDTMYIGQFDFFKDRDINAMYENSSIFITNEQDDIDDMADDIVHEVAHSVEETYRDFIYSDGSLEQEFIQKRKQLYSILQSENVPNLELGQFIHPYYNRQFDDFLENEIGYPLLDMLSSNIFYSPYAATSLREYFANGFEAFYFFQEPDFLQKFCPVLFEKLYGTMEEKL